MDTKAVANLEDSQKFDENDWKVGLDAGDKIRMCSACARTGGALQSTCYRCKLLVTSAEAMDHGGRGRSKSPIPGGGGDRGRSKSPIPGGARSRSKSPAPGLHYTKKDLENAAVDVHRERYIHGTAAFPVRK